MVKLFDTYFSAVNRHDVSSAVATFDPAGVVNNTDPGQVDKFAAQTSTSFDDNAALHSLRSDPDHAGGLLVLATFRSRQAASLGPGGQTCSSWRLTYILTRNAGGYRIFGAQNPTSTAC